MYFDPGTGSMLIQIILAFFASVGVFFIAFKNKIKKFFRRSKNEKNK